MDSGKVFKHDEQIEDISDKGGASHLSSQGDCIHYMAQLLFIRFVHFFREQRR